MIHIAHTLRAFALTTLLALSVRGATFTVTNNNDSGAGSLRQALVDAAGASGADIVNFDTSLSGATITLASEILVDDADGVTVEGGGLATPVTIDGGTGTHRLIKLNPSRSLTLIGLAFANGHGGTSDAGRGGAINSNGVLTLTRCVFTSNSAAAGGAVRNTGTLSATDCSFTNNTSPNQGGAIHSPGAMTLTRCTFTGNSADEGGATYGNSATVTQCTFSGNTGRSGAAIIFFGAMNLSHSTVWGNIVSPPGGTAVSIRSTGGVLTLANCIVEGIMNFGTFTREGANIVTTLINAGGTGTDSGPAAITSDPLLGALASNGGLTQTMTLLAGSPAIDAAVGSTITSDQRGLSLYGTPDLGAFEYNGGIITVTTNADSGAGSLRQAIADAAAFSGVNTIDFDASLSGATITLASEITITDTDGVTIDGATLPSGITVSGNSQVRVFVLSSGSIANLISLNLTAGNSGGIDGGAIRNLGTLTVTGCSFSGCNARDGGAINNSGVLALTRCTLSGNTASRFGGAISGLPTTLTHCTISGNSAGREGGGIKQFVNSWTMNFTIVAGNTATDVFSLNFGGFFSGTGNLTSGNPLLGTLANNGGPTQTMALLAGSPAIDAATGSTATTDQRGQLLYGTADIGAYEYKGGYFTVLNTNDSGAGSLRQAIADAAAASGANTIDFDASLSGLTITFASEIPVTDVQGVTIDASALPGGLTLDGNNACRHFNIGTGAVLNLVALNLTRGSAIDNTPPDYHGRQGGSIFNDGTLTATRCSFYSNYASWIGGAIANNDYSSSPAFYLNSCTVANNHSEHYGGAVAAYNSTGVLTHCTISGNSSYAFGVAFNPGSEFHYCIVTGNSAGFLPDSGTPIGPNLIGGDAKLAPLGNYGGPTKTMALLAGSAAIDAATGSTITSDQRGQAVVGTPDLGAYEHPQTAQTITFTNPGAHLVDDAPFALSATASSGLPVTLAIVSGPATLSGSTLTVTGTGDVTVRASQAGDATYNAAADVDHTFAVVSTVVTTNADSGAGSLRQALADAALVAGANTITLVASLSGQTIAFGSEIVVNDTGEVAIDASALAGGITLNGGGGGRLFSVASGSSLALVGVTLTGGNGAGAANNGAGGAILSYGALSLAHCTLSGNTAAGGGAIWQAGGSLALTQCTISGNSATGAGGAVFHDLVIGAHYTHCTISGNTADYGGGIYVFQRSTTLENCILAGNTATTAGADILSDAAAITSAGANIIQSSAAVNGMGGYVNPGTVSTADPLLAALANNGGPTKTMALQAGSPAIDAAVGSTVTTDQRGKFLYGWADVGAYEYKGGTAVVTSAADSGAGSLRQALAVVAASPGADAIEFAAVMNGATIMLASALAVNDADGVTVNASMLASGLTLDGNNACRIFNIGTGAVLNLVALNITRGNGDGTPYNEGGAISNDGTLIASRCSFYDNHCAWIGGAINNVTASAAMYLTSCTIANNSAPHYGGGLGAYGSTAVLTHCTVTGNSTYAFGAAFGSVDYHYCIVTGNSAGFLPDAGNPVGPNLIGGDAKLLALGNYGGSTKTMALLAGSPAIDAATGSTVTSDQRGFSMIGTPDLGAFETHAPTAVDDLAKLPTGVATTIDVLANDSSPDHLALTIVSASRPRGGSVTIVGGTSILYTPNSRYNGTDSFTYTIADSNGETSTAAVRVRNPFPAHAGSFQSLIVTGTPSRDGLATVRVTKKGAFTLSLKTASGNFSKTGTMNGDGNAIVTIDRPGLPSLTAILALDVVSGAFDISIDDTTGAVNGTFSKKIRYSANDPSPEEGKYTMLLPAPEKTTETKATATPIITAGKITGITLTNGGDGYTDAPKITFTRASGTGTAATAKAVVADGKVTGFTITSQGTGYTAGSTVDVSEPAGQPRGTGYATVTVSESGAVVVTGKLGDGTPFSAGGFMNGNDAANGYTLRTNLPESRPSYPLYTRAYAKAGRVYGTLAFRDVPNTSDFDGMIYWNKPSQTTEQMFQNGFTATTTGIGSTYVPPTAGDYVLDVETNTGNAKVDLQDGDLTSGIEKLVTVTPASTTSTISNKVSAVTPGADGLTVALTASTGLFTGSVATDLTTPAVKKTFSGVLFQKQNLGAGVFSGKKQTGSVMIKTP